MKKPSLPIEVASAELQTLLEWRERYRREMNCQIVHDSWHARGFTQLYALSLAGRPVGYGAITGDRPGPMDIVKEFYVEPAHRAAALDLLQAFLAATGARWIEAQTNDPLLSFLLYDSAVELASSTILFADALTTALEAPGALVRRLSTAEREQAFRHSTEPVGDWGIEAGGEVVATGGFFLHYNPPYADLYMEVAPQERQRGYGSYLIQELKRECYGAGYVPAARCNVDNVASRRTLQRAGLLPCGWIVRGRVATVAAPGR
jgi:GNAT superfamily N-acetyltransferase